MEQICKTPEKAAKFVGYVICPIASLTVTTTTLAGCKGIFKLV